MGKPDIDTRNNMTQCVLSIDNMSPWGVETVAFGAEGLPSVMVATIIDHDHEIKYTIVIDVASSTVVTFEYEYYGDDVIFKDGFASGGTARWTRSIP